MINTTTSVLTTLMARLPEEVVRTSKNYSGPTNITLGGMQCVPSSISDFPGDPFTDAQRHSGAVAFHFLVAAYCFAVIALVCRDYFLPSVELICEALNLSEDVAGATFMAIATSAPELFVNVVGTFVSETDLGVGTVVGSGVFNTLMVPAIGGLAARKSLSMDRWALTRDCVLYLLAVGALAAVAWDGEVRWFEAGALLFGLVIYFTLMCGDGRLKALSNSRKGLCGGPRDQMPTVSAKVDLAMQESAVSSRRPPSRGPWCHLLWPILAPLVLTIPDCRKDRWRRAYPVTFLMCVIWIAASSYAIAWMITVIGDNFDVPDSVMGLTLMAAGGSVPEAISSALMARKGVGSVGLSNSLGANTLDILLCLGLPWLVKCLLPGPGVVMLVSSGVAYSCLALVCAVALLYGAVAACGFRLGRVLGGLCLVLYFGALVLPLCVELNVFGRVNPPGCGG